MKDEKDFKASAAEAEEKIEAELDKSEDYEQQRLNEELEKLAETFRAEMKKAKEENKNVFDELEAEEKSGIPKEELCECCGKRKKDTSVSENYPYCTECREGMKKYPFNISSLVTAIAIVVVAVFGVLGFVTDFNGYNLARAAKEADRNNEKYTAVENYVAACTIFEEKAVVPKLLYRESAENIFATLPEGVKSFYQITEIIDSSMSPVEAKLPIFKGYIDLRNRAATMYSTFNSFYGIYNNMEYAGLTPEDKENVLKLYNEIAALKDKELTIEDVNGDELTVIHDEAAVLFSQFMFAYSFGQHELAYESLKELDEKYPELISMYGYELAVLDIQSGNFKSANSLAKRVMEVNKEDSSAYDIYVYSYRMKGDYDKSIAFADLGLEVDPANSDLYRQKAITLLLKGEKKEALAVIEEGLALGDYPIMQCICLIIANENGDTKKVEEMKSKLDEYKIELPEKVQKYLAGELSYKKLFTEGTGDIE